VTTSGKELVMQVERLTTRLPSPSVTGRGPRPPFAVHDGALPGNATPRPPGRIGPGAAPDTARIRGDGPARWFALGRLDSLRTEGGFTIWLQLRGRTRIRAREGEFTLAPGDWLALARDSAPKLQADRHAASLGLWLPPEAAGARSADLVPGRGRMPLRELRIATRLWRNGRIASHGCDETAMPLLSALLSHLAAQQRDFDACIARCPGRSLRRRRQVFARMQRARLYLEGHRDRVVRLAELAELTSFSSWYLSKTYHELYGESPQAASVRLRLERACELLAASDGAIGEIGAACGFDNSCSFARAFRARLRTTASAWRDAARRETRIGTGARPAARSLAADANIRACLISPYSTR
jgi:AraC family transcriptional regulator